MKLTSALFASLALFVLAPAAAMAARSTASASTGTLTVRSSPYGRILFDGKGRALYAFTRDPRSRSACNGACLAAWPAYVVTSRPKAGPGVKTTLLGTIRRPDGKLQVTYGKRALYYYVHDPVGKVLCQNVDEFGGLWLVVRPTGTLVR